MKTVTYDEKKWRLVPNEATLSMTAAFGRAPKDISMDKTIANGWTAMLEAAPQPGEVVGEAVAWQSRITPSSTGIPNAWRECSYERYLELSRSTDCRIEVRELYDHPQPDAARDADARKAFALDALIAAGYVDQLKADEAMDLWPEYADNRAMAAGRGEVG